jgi:N-acetyl sugar amidotransferase
MVTCNNCLYDSRHPFGISEFEGLCSGCFTHKEKYQDIWGNKKEELLKLVKNIKKKGLKHECVVPVTGDAEDFFVVNEIVKLGLNPLLVNVNSYFSNDIGWKNLHTLITNFDLDSLIYNPEIFNYKQLIRNSLRKYNHMMLPFHMLHTSFPVHIAMSKKIPLIIWGSNQPVEQVGKFSHLDNVKMSKWSRVEHDLFGIDLDTLIGTGAEINVRKLDFYKYPDIKKIAKNVIGIYLSNYLPWDPLKQNQSSVDLGFTPEKNNYSFDIYERAGSSVYYGVHDLLKYERLGYRKILDHVSREIRHGRLSKELGNEIVIRYTENGVDLNPFFSWLGVTKSGREWFIEKRLTRSKALANNFCNEIFIKDIIGVEHILNDFIFETPRSQETFVKYYKGI